MLNKITQLLRSIDLNKHSPIVLGVSGGADSISMLYTLKELGYKLIIAYYDHSLRDDSVLDSIEVMNIAEKLNIKYVTSKGDTKEYSIKNGLSIEEAARKLRYSFLFEVAKEEKAQAVSVAHNAEDQAETILMHILRGSGLKGLRGMQVKSMSEWSHKIPLIRPLLIIWPKEIDQYCQEKDLSILIDPTNVDTKYLRNKIRHELFPILEEYNPNIKGNLINLGLVSTEDYKLIDQLLIKEWENCGEMLGNHCAKLSIEKLKTRELSMKRLLIRKSIFLIKSELNNIDFSDIERVISFVDEPSNSKRIDLASNLKLEIFKDYLYIYDSGFDINFDDNPQLLGQIKILNIPGLTKLDSKWKIESEIIDFSEELFIKVKNNQDENLAFLDAEKTGKIINLRTFQKGDYFQPLGMNGKKVKLSDYFIDQKIIQLDRAKWPLICTKEDTIIWVFKKRISNGFRVTEHTKKILRLRGFKKK